MKFKYLLGVLCSALVLASAQSAEKPNILVIMGDDIGMPESAAPKLGKNSNLVTMEVDVPQDANGVIYALAGFSGGLI